MNYIYSCFYYLPAGSYVQGFTTSTAPPRMLEKQIKGSSGPSVEKDESEEKYSKHYPSSYEARLSEGYSEEHCSGYHWVNNDDGWAKNK